MINERKIRVLICKMGLDAHDKGARIIAWALRDAGMEVVYLGDYQMPETVLNAAAHEDVDVIGVSCLSGQQTTIIPRLASLIKERGLNDVKLIVGGIFPKEEIPMLKEVGVDEVFIGTSPKPVIDYLRSHVKPGRR